MLFVVSILVMFLIVGSLCCTTETNAILCIKYFSIKNIKIKNSYFKIQVFPEVTD